MKLKRFVTTIAALLLAVGLMAQSDPVLLLPVTVDPTPAHPSEKPPIDTQRLATLTDAANFEKRYGARFEAVYKWATDRGVPPTFKIHTTFAPNLGDPAQSYVQQAISFIDEESGIESGHHSLPLFLRAPRITVVELAGVFQGVTELPPWVEPARPLTQGSTPPSPTAQIGFGPPIEAGEFAGSYSVSATNTVPLGTHASRNGIEYVYVELARGFTGRLRLWIPVGN